MCQVETIIQKDILLQQGFTGQGLLMKLEVKLVSLHCETPNSLQCDLQLPQRFRAPPLRLL